jgi:oligopeptide/dipeptide ABC transporter ATP-binding protein
MLAMALCEKPKLLIADEPTTALDVTTQVQVLHLIQEIVQRENMSVLLITHDLAIAGSICDTLAVMYGGIIQEMGPTERILRDPRHPYTVALIKSVPSKTKTEGKLEAITGSFTETAIQKECAFAPRCPSAWDACRKGVPSLLSCDGRLVRCVNYGESYEN